MTKLSDCMSYKQSHKISQMANTKLSKVSTSIHDRLLLKDTIVEYNGNYQYVKYGHDAIIWNDLGYVAECLKCAPLSDNDAVIESIYNEATNTLSVQISLNTLRKD